MAKSLSSLWLKSLRRLGKVQKTQQARGRKLFKSLLPKPPKAVRAAPKAAKRSRPSQIVAARPAPAVLGLPGSWQKSYFSVPGAGQLAPARRLL